MKKLHLTALTLCAATLLYALSTRADENKNTPRIPAESTQIKGIPIPEASGASGIWAPSTSTQKLLIGKATETASLAFATNTDVTFYDGGESLRIVGLLTRSEPPADYPKDKVWFYSHDHYSRPEKPDDVKVILTTKDGRKWNAKWEEAK